jgi:hypothetical protein
MADAAQVAAGLCGGGLHGCHHFVLGAWDHYLAGRNRGYALLSGLRQSIITD